MAVSVAQFPDTAPHPDAHLPERIPRHVAIIMDGNGRWAASRGLPRSEGHRRGTENLRTTIRAAVEFGVQILTVYAFSTENWGRPRREVKLLLRILEMVIDRELRELHENGVQIRHIGELNGIPENLQRKVVQACDYTKRNTRLILNVAFNYGGRDEIVHAVRRIVESGIPADQINEDTIAANLYTAGLPDPDLIIRTSGELRVSNFLIWQGSYSEYYATDVFWPDFNRAEFLKALHDYNGRRRRFGLTDAQIEGQDDPDDEG
ncbi:MAG: isoprenyl transferase [Anaerolineae bacterium]|jgi:undecaprenyl diphosphate synthase|nr:isoprenyl transferase [Anaerolineae bacterium]